MKKVVVSIKFTPKTKEQLHEENLQRLQNFRPLDDDFMRELFRNNLPLAQFVLRILTGINDLVLIEETTQYDMNRLVGARSLCLDVLGVDSLGRKFDMEIQRADSGATPKRARYHSSAMDIEFLNAGDNFEELPITYTIFITENDVRAEGRAIYCFENTDTVTGKPLNDGAHIIFVNGAYAKEDDSSDIAKLIHDFRCTNADDMNFHELAERTRYFKNNPKGVGYMCKAIEDMRKEAAEEVALQIALSLLESGKHSKEEIAEYCKLSLEEVAELAAQIESSDE